MYISVFIVKFLNSKLMHCKWLLKKRNALIVTFGLNSLKCIFELNEYLLAWYSSAIAKKNTHTKKHQHQNRICDNVYNIILFILAGLSKHYKTVSSLFYNDKVSSNFIRTIALESHPCMFL
jgi:uncharacterized membrane protein YccF (DUF307 family)